MTAERRALTVGEQRLQAAARMPEAELQEHIRKACVEDLGLRYYHVHDSRRDYAGFLDCVIVGPHGLVFAELKSAKGAVRPAQAQWIEALTTVRTLSGGTVQVYVWRPIDWLDGTIPAVLARLKYGDRVRTSGTGGAS